MKKDSYIERILVLSTAHMPETSPDFGSIAVIEYNYGYILTSISPDYIENLALVIPDWIKPILKFSSKQKAHMLMFDRDGNEEPDLKTYDW